jgi:hypothetical protein
VLVAASGNHNYYFQAGLYTMKIIATKKHNKISCLNIGKSLLTWQTSNAGNNWHIRGQPKQAAPGTANNKTSA